ncbi:hypothetical protein AAHB37_00100 [Glutamicibacter halophytocola]|uniref:hypothetical protein n=1 Tax=Glutamicibacter halophytocola TaxID=1933880 RepID=UPI00321A60C0
MNRSATVQGRRMERRPRSAGNVVVGFLGELFITLGIILMLYVAWELWWTNIDSAQAQQQATQGLVQELGDVVIPDSEDPADDEKDYGPAPVTEIAPGGDLRDHVLPAFWRPWIASPRDRRR